MTLPGDEPIAVLNLFKFNLVAQYQAEDPEYGTPAAEISGAEAYQKYSAEAGPPIYALGGRLHVSTAVDQVAIGPPDKSWDMVGILVFPSRQAFIDMMDDPKFQTASRHRKAALADHFMLHLQGDPFLALMGGYGDA